ncbi:hypothetical protein Q5P01_006908 [Channa striata]|uniref:Uncharacterized protein n=1 Tax=Channa striata TaxID=64152 RepID=A0AA88N9Q8_CHASR|nr:hypothetical protein Q5P01_006908 [Channa striata]
MRTSVTLTAPGGNASINQQNNLSPPNHYMPVKYQRRYKYRGAWSRLLWILGGSRDAVLDGAACSTFWPLV